MKRSERKTYEIVKAQMQELYGVDVKVLPPDEYKNRMENGMVFLDETIGEVAPLFAGMGHFLHSEEFLNMKYGQLYTLDAPLDKLTSSSKGLLAQVRENGRIVENVAVNPVNLNASNVVSLVFSAVAIAAEAKYRKNLDQKLNNIQEQCLSIKHFLELDKIASMESDMKMLQDVLHHLEIVGGDASSKSAYLTTVLSIRKEAEQNKIFYLNELNARMNSYSTKKKEDVKEKKLRKARDLDTMARLMGCYKYSTNLAAFTWVMELYLTDIFDQARRTMVESHMETLREELYTTVDSLSQFLLTNYHSKLSTKLMHGISKAASKYAEAPVGAKIATGVLLAPVGAVEGGSKLVKHFGKSKRDSDDVLNEFSDSLEKKTNETGNEFAGNIVSVEDRQMLDGYVDGLQLMHDICAERIAVCIDDESKVSIIKEV